MKQLFSILTIITILSADNFKTVFQKNITLDEQTPAILTLKEENIEKFAETPAKIMINYEENKTKKEYIFIDTSKQFPIYYFNGLTFNSEVKENLNLVNSLNIFDADQDGSNEIFVYGTSHYGGSGLVGKVVVLRKNSKGNIEKIALIEAKDNFEIHYIKKENIIVVAQYIWRAGIEGHYGDKHRYKLTIYEPSSHYKKLPMMITSKKYHDTNSSVIKENLEELLKKYTVCKAGKLTPKETAKYISFVKKYWDTLGQKRLQNIENFYAPAVEYYEKKLPKEKVLEELKRFYANTKETKFELSDFLLYKRGDKIIIEYIKSYSEDNDTEYGTVKSLMELQTINNKPAISKENDEIILEDRKDLE